MSYIYEIVNDVNGKRYVGKTEFSIEKRFKEHCKDAFRERNEKRPLYDAMKKYGVEHFHVFLLEETDNPEEREIYWIKEKDSYHNGYNATLGGDGKKYLNYQEVIDKYRELENCTEVSRVLGISRDYVSDILKKNNIKVLSSGEIAKRKNFKRVGMFTKDNPPIFIKEFPSYLAAARYLEESGIIPHQASIDGVGGHINNVCKGRRKSAYGYYWKLLE